MIEGARRSGCEKKIWRHNDVAHLEQLLIEAGRDRVKGIVCESLYSMDGDIARSTRSWSWPSDTMRSLISTKFTQLACTARGEEGSPNVKAS